MARDARASEGRSGGGVVRLVARFVRNGQEWTQPVVDWTPDGVPRVFVEDNPDGPWLRDAREFPGFAGIEEEGE